MSKRRATFFKILKKVSSLAVLTAVATGIATSLSLYLNNREVDLAEQSQIADRLEKAQAKLESAKSSDQLNGIYQLQRAAEVFPDRVSAIIDQITVFLQLKVGADAKTCGLQSTSHIAMTALNVIGKINIADAGPTNLIGVCLSNLQLADANLSNIDFAKSDLRGSTFINVAFNKSRFDFTKLTDTHFIMTDLTSAVFCYADIQSAEFRSGTFSHTAIDDRKNATLRRAVADTSVLEACP